MNILLTTQQFSPKNIQISDIKQNKLMNGIFTKVGYRDENTGFNGVYLSFTIENPTTETKEKVYYTP